MKDILNYENQYAITKDGQVWSYKKNKFLIPRINRSGYYQVVLHNHCKLKTFTIHKLVAEAYIPNPNNYPTIDHIDRNRLNNNVTNLRWASWETQCENKDKEKMKQNLNKARQKSIENNQKKVQQRDKDNHNILIAEYDNSIEAAKNMRKENIKGAARNIRCACTKYKNQETAYGYYWIYVEEDD